MLSQVQRSLRRRAGFLNCFQNIYWIIFKLYLSKKKIVAFYLVFSVGRKMPFLGNKKQVKETIFGL